MRTFKDANDHEWTIKLDAPTILRIRAVTCDVERCKHLQGRGCSGVDLGDRTGETQRQLRGDVVMLVNTLYLLCQKEAQERGVSDEQFGACLVGDAIERATIAMDEAIADFFQESTRKILRAVAAKDQEVRELGLARALARINDPKLTESILSAMEAQLDAEVQKLLTPSSSATNSPAS